jgi:hypothetical protein
LIQRQLITGINKLDKDTLNLYTALRAELGLAPGSGAAKGISGLGESREAGFREEVQV